MLKSKDESLRKGSLTQMGALADQGMLDTAG